MAMPMVATMFAGETASGCLPMPAMTPNAALKRPAAIVAASA